MLLMFIIDPSKVTLKCVIFRDRLEVHAKEFGYIMSWGGLIAHVSEKKVIGFNSYC